MSDPESRAPVYEYLPDVADRIVRDLAALPCPSDYWGHECCVLCGADGDREHVIAGLGPEAHKPECPWRRAKEYVAHQADPPFPVACLGGAEHAWSDVTWDFIGHLREIAGAKPQRCERCYAARVIERRG